MTTQEKQFTKESGHWYDRDGLPRYEVPCKSRPGEMRATTVRDARALDLVPSVTSILRTIAKPGLERWKLNQVLHAALTLPRLAGEQEDAFAERVIADSEEQGKKAREKGTAIHGAIELSLAGKPFDQTLVPHVSAALEALRSKGIDTLSRKIEHSFASHLGYGGKIDIHGESFIVDFKTKNSWTEADEKKGIGYDEHAMQLVAYAKGMSLVTPKLINVFISVDNPGQWCAHEWSSDRYEHYWSRFLCLLEYWKLTNGFQ